jgi:predicted amidohydrolase
MSSKIGNVPANREKILSLLKRDMDYNADFLILPEVWTVGWACEHFVMSAENFEKSPTIKMLSDLAKKYNTNILGGSLIEKTTNGKYYNSCPVINRNGELVAKYSKMHLYSYCGCTEGSYISEGEYPVMVELDGIKIGLTICYDIRFPEIFRAYRASGADLLVNMAAWGSKKPIPWETLTRARAIENQCFMVGLTQSGEITSEEWNIGHSRIFDYVGETLTEIKDQKEGLMKCEISLNDMYKYRETCTILKDIKGKYEVRVI